MSGTPWHYGKYGYNNPWHLDSRHYFWHNTPEHHNP